MRQRYKNPEVSERDKPILRVGNDTMQNARRGVRVCPFCDYSMDGSGGWDRVATKLILEPRIRKPGHVAIFNQCPKCFEESWCHSEMSQFAYGHECLPAEWRKVVSELAAKTRSQAQEDWKNSLCIGCRFLKSVNVRWYPYRQCESRNWSMVGEAVVECDKYKPKKRGPQENKP